MWDAQYYYRPDGLRVQKNIDADTEQMGGDSSFSDEDSVDNDATTDYYYDGQMVVGERHTYYHQGGFAEDHTENVVGPRGIDMQRVKVRSGPWTESCPVYDGHGNMVCSLAIARPALVAPSGGGAAVFGGGNGFVTTWNTTGDKKYNVLGAVNQGNSQYINTKYCANLGHIFDDELGLIYMRARYYEPSTEFSQS